MAIPRDCEALAANVADPAVDAGKNPKRAVAEYAIALGDANDNLDATRTCQQRQRQRFARGARQ